MNTWLLNKINVINLPFLITLVVSLLMVMYWSEVVAVELTDTALKDALAAGKSGLGAIMNTGLWSGAAYSAGYGIWKGEYQYVLIAAGIAIGSKVLNGYITTSNTCLI